MLGGDRKDRLETRNLIYQRGLGKKKPQTHTRKGQQIHSFAKQKKIIHSKQIQEEGYLGSKLCLIILFQRAVRHHTVQSTVSAARQVTGATAAVYSNSPHEEQSDFQICLNSQQRNGKHQKQAEKKQAEKDIFFFPFSSHLLNKISVNKSTLGASNLGCVHYSTYEPVTEQTRKNMGHLKFYYSFYVVWLLSQLNTRKLKANWFVSL